MNLLEIDARLKDLVNEFIQNWNEGQRKTFEVGIYELGICRMPNEGEIDSIGTEITYITSIESVEDDMLLIEVDENVLKACYEAQLEESISESDLKQLGRYESCGWI